MGLRRLLRKLFHEHKFEPFELMEDYLPVVGPDGKPLQQVRDEGPKVWYVGYRCRCGDAGYRIGPMSWD